MPYALDASGRPLFLISTMAVHTQNLGRRRDGPACSSREPDWAGDPLAAGRVTLMGVVRRRPDRRAGRGARRRTSPATRTPPTGSTSRTSRSTGSRSATSTSSAASRPWTGSTGRPTGAARVDPLADVAAGILEHMNKDHPDALVVYARALGGAPDAEAATMVAVDRLGFRLRIRSAAAPPRRADRLSRGGHERRRRPARPDPDAPGRARPAPDAGRPHDAHASGVLGSPSPAPSRTWRSVSGRPPTRSSRTTSRCWRHGSMASCTRCRATSRMPATGTGAPGGPSRGPAGVQAEIAEARRAMESGTRLAKEQA